MKRLIALALVGVIAIVHAYGQTDLVELNHAEITLIALGVLAFLFVVLYTLAKVWERRLNR